MPLLLSILGGFVVGAVGVSLASLPGAQSVVIAARPSVGVVVAERPSGVTSGTAFVAGDRLVLAAYHVVAGASRLRLKLAGSDWVEPKVIDTDVYTGLAVLTLPEISAPPLPLETIANVQEGERVVVISFPRVDELNAQSQSAVVTDGTVSGIRNGFLLIQASWSPGGSGAPILSLRGKVIGLIRGQVPGAQPRMNVAIPADVAKPLLESASQHLPLFATAQPEGPVPPPPSPAAPPSAAASQPAPSAPAPPAAPPQPTTPAPPAIPPVPVPAPGPSPSPDAPDAFLIVPGEGIGPVRLGMNVANIISVLGPPKSTSKFSDGTSVYRWFEPPENAGLGVRTLQTGIVFRIWALNDGRYITKERLHPGSTETEVQAALGQPSRVSTDSLAQRKTLIYDSLGMWFAIQLNEQFSFYNAVHEIGVMRPASIK